MKLKKFKERDNKRIGIIIFTIVCILLVSGVILYRTYAIFEVKTNQNVIKGTVQDPGNIYFAFYVNNEIQKDMPKKESEYVLDEEASYDLKELYQNILISANYLELTKQDLDEATDDVAMELNKFPADRVESIPAEIKRQEVLSIINETCEMCESKWQNECEPIVKNIIEENQLGGE